MNRTSIEWTDFTSNPLKYRDADGRVVWACVHASPGCKHCYAETLAKRYGKGEPFNVPTTAKVTPFLDEAELHRMLTYKPASGKRCFVGDMTDLFGEWVPDELLDRLFAVFALRSDVTWQVLTKRAYRLAQYLTPMRRQRVIEAGEAMTPSRPPEHWYYVSDWSCRLSQWPLPNVWLGVSAETQQYADERIPLLLQTPAAVRFVSAEPLLGPVNLWSDANYPLPGGGIGSAFNWGKGIGWVIVGGESGPGARPCDVEWVRSIVRQCAAASVACFVKQDSGPRPGQQGRIPSDLFLKEFPNAS